MIATKIAFAEDPSLAGSAAAVIAAGVGNNFSILPVRCETASPVVRPLAPAYLAGCIDRAVSQGSRVINIGYRTVDEDYKELTEFVRRHPSVLFVFSEGLILSNEILIRSSFFASEKKRLLVGGITNPSIHESQSARIMERSLYILPRKVKGTR